MDAKSIALLEFPLIRERLAAAAGFATTAGSSQPYLVEVDCEQMGTSGYQYLQLKFSEVVNSPVLGGVIVLMIGDRYQQDVPGTVVT